MDQQGVRSNGRSRNRWGDLADKLGGRAVRGALGGKPREMLSVLPFSDSLGITDHKDRVSGRNLTDKYGLTRRGDNGWGAWGTGLATEFALDPLNLVGIGAAGRLGLKSAILEHISLMAFEPTVRVRLGTQENSPFASSLALQTSSATKQDNSDSEAPEVIKVLAT
jgi:hypothetical protein